MLRRIVLWLVGGLLLTILFALVYNRVIVRTLYPATPTPIFVPTPPTLPHLPTFVPTFPCELENAEVHNDVTCYNERVEETEVADSGTSVLSLRKLHIGSGCFGSISSDTQALRLCDKSSGAGATTLLDNVVGNSLPSPDGQWLAVTTFRWGSDADPTSTIPSIDVYKVSVDGHTVTRLDAHGFPHGTVGVNVVRWEPSGDWLNVEVWNGSENSWRSFRLKTDGSGVMGPVRPSPIPSPPTPPPQDEG